MIIGVIRHQVFPKLWFLYNRLCFFSPIKRLKGEVRPGTGHEDPERM